MRILLHFGGNANVLDNDGDTALHFAVRENNLHTAKLLIDYGADVNAENHSGETPLLLAIQHRYDRMVHFLLPYYDYNASS